MIKWHTHFKINKWGPPLFSYFLFIWSLLIVKLLIFPYTCNFIASSRYCPDIFTGCSTLEMFFLCVCKMLPSIKKSMSSQNLKTQNLNLYHMEGNFGSGKIWRIVYWWMTLTLYVQLATSDSCLVLMQFWHSRLVWTLEVSTVPSN